VQTAGRGQLREFRDLKVIDPLSKGESELVSACQKGDSAAASELVELHWHRVYAFAFRLSLNAADAEDITQETFLRAFENLGEYKLGGSFRAWLLRIASHLFLDRKKSASAHTVSTSELTELAQRGPAPVEAAETREILDAVQSALQGLSTEQRCVVVLRAVERLDFAEISSILQMNENTVRWHMYEARRSLRQLLSKKFDLEAFGDE
jgi:RNA polymerase sigma-70 factor (ECF subfamily)